MAVFGGSGDFAAVSSQFLNKHHKSNCHTKAHCYNSFGWVNMLQYICIRYFQVILHILYSHDNLQHIKNAPKKPQTKQMLIFPPKFFWITYFHAQHNITYSLKWISFLCFIQMPKLIFFCVFAIKIFVANGTIILFLTYPCFKIKLQDGGLTPL